MLGSAVLQETSGPEQGVIQRFGGAMTFPEISISQPVPGMSPLMICLGSLENRESLFFLSFKNTAALGAELCLPGPSGWLDMSCPGPRHLLLRGHFSFSLRNTSSTQIHFFSS